MSYKWCLEYIALLLYTAHPMLIFNTLMFTKELKQYRLATRGRNNFGSVPDIEPDRLLKCMATFLLRDSTPVQSRRI